MTTFTDLALIDPLLRALSAEGYTTPTPIQVQAIPHLLTGRDLLGCAQTGTGKTAAFALPILQRLTANRRPAPPKSARTLILTPTRELAAQIGDSFRAYGRFLKVSRTVIFGGVGQGPQVASLTRGVDVMIATPGRLLDLMEQGHARLDGIEVFVLDEADRMLDMGFIHDIRRIVAKVPKQRQTLLFSATLPDDITDLATGMLTEPVRVSVTPPAATADRIEQKLLFVEREDKRALLTEILKDPGIDRAVVFTRTKHGADRVARQLESAAVSAEAIHGNKSQNARIRALANFKEGRTRVLVATDIAARGIDIDGITHVINFDLPNVPESYVHRIGRTARAGASGVAISFCDSEERAYLRDIEKLLKRSIPVVADHPFRSAVPHHAGPSRPASRPAAPRNASARPAAPRSRQGDGGYGGRGGRPAAGNRGQARASGQRSWMQEL